MQIKVMLKTMQAKLVAMLIIACGTFLAGCASTPTQTVQTEPPSQADYGLWQLEECRVSASRAGITLSTDGALSNGTIHLKLTSQTPLRQAPILELTSWPKRFFLYGDGQHFSTELPYSPAAVNRLLHAQSFVSVKFASKFSETEEFAYFSTRGLPEALKDLSQQCR